ncbi:hypothetical protein Y032_0002g1057 [Ancylostoma ceylanicum]|uniref:Uncharacterized protein n=1 Tax=Ancylostoma ceylanicum TaxID=53326 RepID=A0A016W0A7_9BILA|nr:hypothetical protein Y032_0002g1057 [Ancylostoma ceylanicum]
MRKLTRCSTNMRDVEPHTTMRECHQQTTENCSAVVHELIGGNLISYTLGGSGISSLVIDNCSFLLFILGFRIGIQNASSVFLAEISCL